MTDLRLEVQPDRLVCARGDQASVDVALRNVSDVVEHYETLVLGLPDGVSAAVDPPVAKLRPGERASTTVTLHVEGDPAAGHYVLGLLMRTPHQDESGPGVSRCEEVELRIARHDEVLLTAEPSRLEGGGLATFTAQVANRGNAPVRVHLSGSDSQGGASFVFNPAWVDVPVAAQVAAEASVRCRPPWTGQPRQRELTVTGSRTEDGSLDAPEIGPVTAQATFQQRARLAPAALRSARGLITMAVGVATILGAALLTREGTDDDAAEATSVTSPEEGDGESATDDNSETDAGGESEGGSSGSPDTTSPPTGPPGPEPTELNLFDIEVDDPVDPATPDVALDTDAFADQGLSVVAGRGGESGSPCQDATGLAVHQPGDPAEGYVQPAQPDDPSACHDVPLQVTFATQPRRVEVFLPTAADGIYEVAATFTDSDGTVPRTVQQKPDDAPGKPDFEIETEGSVVETFILRPVETGEGEGIGDGEASPVAISWLRVRVSGS